jgi:hypothetical protein
MARFKYLGEIPPHGGLLVSQGPCKQIRIPLKNGGTQVITAANQTTGFVIGSDIGTDIMDSRAIRCMQADMRFAQLS